MYAALAMRVISGPPEVRQGDRPITHPTIWMAVVIGPVSHYLVTKKTPLRETMRRKTYPCGPCVDYLMRRTFAMTMM